MKLFWLLAWALMAGLALSVFLDPEFPGILDILNRF